MHTHSHTHTHTHTHTHAHTQWMADNWQKDPCYGNNGVDGSRCSFQDYLSLVESWCPPRPGSVSVDKDRNKKVRTISEVY